MDEFRHHPLSQRTFVREFLRWFLSSQAWIYFCRGGVVAHVTVLFSVSQFHRIALWWLVLTIIATAGSQQRSQLAVRRVYWDPLERDSFNSALEAVRYASSSSSSWSRSLELSPCPSLCVVRWFVGFCELAREEGKWSRGEPFSPHFFVRRPMLVEN